MQAYDLIMLIVLGMATIFGAIKGFAWQVASLASILISYLVAYRFRFQVAEMIHAAPPWNLFLAMLILYVGTSFIIWVGFRLLSGAIDKVRLKEFDRHIGAAFGLGKGLIYCLLITMFAMSLLGPKQQAAICQSRSGYYIASALDKGVGILPKEIHDVVGPYLEQLDAKLKNGQNGMPVANDSNWQLNLPGINLPGQTPGQSIGQGAGQGTGLGAGQGTGNGWDLGQILPNVLEGLPSTNNSQPPTNGGFQNNFSPNNFPPIGSGNGNAAQQNFGQPDSIFPPAGNFAPPGSGFTSEYNNGAPSQSAQQPNYALPR